MVSVSLLRECYSHNDWARDKLLALSAGLDDAQLDRPFAMGPGSLRATLQHLYGSERTWFVRWQGHEDPACPPANTLRALPGLGAAHHSLGAARERTLAPLKNPDLAQPITFQSQAGPMITRGLGDILLHGFNHGVHHRAQALNMLRHLGVTLPRGLDYIFMKAEQATTTNTVIPPPLDVASLQTYFAYNDWACAKVYAVAKTLTSVRLEQPFEMGEGSLGGSLAHLRDGEQWWLQNWTQGPGQPFPETDARTPLAELARQSAETQAQRNAFLAGLADGDLLRPTTVTPRPGIHRTFPLGVTMLQVCCHGTHHRAQVLNMFRQVGADVPRLDYMALLGEQQAS
jgi:uncharacterized damage-inducible protein DinB